MLRLPFLAASKVNPITSVRTLYIIKSVPRATAFNEYYEHYLIKQIFNRISQIVVIYTNARSERHNFSLNLREIEQRNRLL